MAKPRGLGLISPHGFNQLGNVHLPGHWVRQKRLPRKTMHDGPVRADERLVHPVRQWQDQVCSHHPPQFLCSTVPGDQKTLSESRQLPEPPVPQRPTRAQENVNEGRRPSGLLTTPPSAATRKRSRQDQDAVKAVPQSATRISQKAPRLLPTKMQRKESMKSTSATESEDFPERPKASSSKTRPARRPAGMQS
jgi:hypothetical protein